MNKVVITDNAKFQDVIDNIEQSYNKIKDLFANQKKNANEIGGTNVWSGATADAVHDKYLQLIENFGPIEYSLELYIKFLKKTLEDYKLVEKEINRNIEDMSQTLDVES